MSSVTVNNPANGEPGVYPIIGQIAKECAMFASDNFPAEEGWSHSAVDMWGAWHDKEGLLAPAMPDLFVSLYDAECEKILPELAAETRAQALPPVPDFRRVFGAFGMSSSQRDQSFLALAQALNEAAKLAEPLDFEVAGAKVSNLLKGMIGHLQRSGYVPFQAVVDPIRHAQRAKGGDAQERQFCQG